MDFNVHIGSVLVTKEQAESPNGNLKLFNTLDPEKHLNTWTHSDLCTRACKCITFPNV